MARHKSRAFVLNARDYRETSRLIQLFCEKEGRISLIAKGMRSPRNPKAQLADTFNLVQVGYTLKENETLGLLTSIEAEEVYSGLRLNLKAYALASFWFEILQVAFQGRMASPELFSRTATFLRHLQEMREFSPATAAMLLDLTGALGFALELQRCGSCGRPDELRCVEIGSGAAICADCPSPRGRTLPFHENLARVVESLGRGDEVRLSRGDAVAFLVLIHEYLSLHLDHRFRTFEFLRKVLVQ